MQPPKILFIPEVAEDRTSDRSPAILRLLRKNHEVVALPSPWDWYLYDPARAKPPRYVLYVLDRALAVLRGVRLAKRSKVELTFCETSHHALVGLWISRIRAVPCVWDSHGNAAVAARSTGKGKGYTFLATSLDRFLGRRVDALIIVSKADAEAYAAMGVPANRLHVIPTSVNVDNVEREAGGDVPDTLADAGGSAVKTLIFFGSFKYGPNLEALSYINERLAPYLEREGIPCRILVAGRDLPPMDLHPLVKPLGFVENIHAVIRHADLCVVPIWSGVGILTKVVDTMATGAPLVLSRLATMGIPEIEDGVHALVAASPDRFPETVAAALRDPEKMRQLARNARRLVEEHYDWRVQEPLLEDLLTGLVKTAGRRPSHGR